MAARCLAICAVLGLIMGVAAPARAERPFVSTERAPTLDHGVSELEFGLNSARFSSQTTRYTLLTELTYGLLDHLNFEVEVPYLFISGPGGTQGVVGDVVLKPKMLFLKGREANPLSLAGEMQLKFPSCDETGPASGEINPSCTGESDLGFTAIATKEFLPLTVHLNVGYTFVGNPPGGNLKNVLGYSLAFEYQTILPAVAVVTELAGETNRDPNTPKDLVTLLFGVTYQVNRRVKLDSSIVSGLTAPSPDYAALLGVAYTF